MIDGIHYLNSGDWVESMTALLEHEDGTWEVYMHKDVIEKSESPEIVDFLDSKQKLIRVAFSNNFFNSLL